MNPESHPNKFKVQFSNVGAVPLGKIWYNRGSEKLTLGNYQGSILDFTNAINADPQDCKYYFNRGFSNFQLEQYQDSIEDCTHSIALNTKYTFAYHVRGEAKTKLGDYCGAIIDCDRTIADYDIAILNDLPC